MSAPTPTDLPPGSQPGVWLGIDETTAVSRAARLLRAGVSAGAVLGGLRGYVEHERRKAAAR